MDRLTVYVTTILLMRKLDLFQFLTRASAFNFLSARVKMATPNDKCLLRRERERAKRLSETPAQRELRLQKRRDAYKKRKDAETGEERERTRLATRSRRAKETPEQRQNRLESLRLADHQRRVNETPEQRQDRLESLRLANHQRRDNETPEQRQERLESMRLNDRQRRANETPEQRDWRLQRQRLHDGQNVIDMNEFHTFVSNTSTYQCTMCHELMLVQLTTATPSAQCCTRCQRHCTLPAMYSDENNMDPGVVPLQLQVS